MTSIIYSSASTYPNPSLSPFPASRHIPPLCIEFYQNHFLADSRLFAREKEGDAGEEQGGVRGGGAPPAYGGGQGGSRIKTAGTARVLL